MAENLEEYDPPKSMRLAIHEIIRVRSELDFLIAIALGAMAEMPLSKSLVLFRRMSIGLKLQNLLYILANEGKSEKRDKMQIIKKGLDEFIKIRNTLAHGIIAGRRGSFVSFYVTDKTELENISTVTFTVRNIHMDAFKHFANTGRVLSEEIRSIFAIAPLAQTLRILYENRRGRDDDVRFPPATE